MSEDPTDNGDVVVEPTENTDETAAEKVPATEGFHSDIGGITEPLQP